MTYEMNDEQFENVISLDGPSRYSHFVSKVTDWEELWSLKNDEGFVAYGDNDGNECLPFWPHPKYAEAIATDKWSDCFPHQIGLSDFLDNWLPGMLSDDVKAVIFPTLNAQGVVVNPTDLKDALIAELEQYE